MPPARSATSDFHGGDDAIALSLDAFVYETKTIVVASAGNSGPDGQVGSPASGQNIIAVGALGGPKDAPPYTLPADYSSSGPNDYFLPAAADGSGGQWLEDQPV